jgi:hypothetical protein
MLASQFGRTTTMALLLESKADIDAKDEVKQSDLMCGPSLLAI